MSVRPRDAKIFAVLLFSMAVGAIILMALGNNPPSAGAFCLNSYYHLDPVEKAALSRAAQFVDRWDSIEIYHSGTKAGNIEQLASLAGLAGLGDINCHFVICNGLGGGNGQIQSTEKWQKQWSTMPLQNDSDSNQTIRICVIADEKNAPPTDFQIKRAATLVEHLSRKFEISPQSTHYPDHWQ